MTIKKSIRLNADATQVWDALTNPDLTPKTMFGCKIITDWEPGSEIVWRNETGEQPVDIMKGRIISLEPYKWLETTIHDAQNVFHDENSHQITLKQELTEENGQTILTITQGDFANVENGEQRYTDASASWEQAFVALQELLDISYEESDANN